MYSCEYGTFIRQISKGWQIVGEHKIAAEEGERFRLWEKFADSICPQIMSAKLRTSIQLLWTTEEHFKRHPSALGALYAFKSQQPATAKSKLEGMRKYYGHWKMSEDYFEKHVEDWQEPELLEEKIYQLNDNEKIIAAEAWHSECMHYGMHSAASWMQA